MSEKLTQADELCQELAETLSRTPDTVEITIKIPHPSLGTTTVTDEEIARLADGEVFRVDGRPQARIARD